MSLPVSGPVGEVTDNLVISREPVAERSASEREKLRCQQHLITLTPVVIVRSGGGGGWLPRLVPVLCSRGWGLVIITI